MTLMKGKPKVAVMFSGLPRGYRGTLLRSRWLWDVDIFMHGWLQNGFFINQIHPNRQREKFGIFDKYELRTLFKPKLYKFENPQSWSIENQKMTAESISKHFEWAIDQNSEKFLSHMLSNNISMWTSIFESWNLLESYSKMNSVNYDYVIRARYDIFPQVDLDMLLEKIESDSIIVPDTNHPKDMVNDWFAIGTFERMKIYCSLISKFPEILQAVQDQHGSWCNELGLSFHLQQSGVNFNAVEMKFQ